MAKKSRWPETSFDESEVAADFSSISRVFSEVVSLRWMARELSFSSALAHAERKALTITCGCTPSSMYGLHSRRNSPASSTTDVVPSPTSASCDIEIWTRVLPAGWTIWSFFMRVAPSFEMVTLPWSSWISLSIPRGPRVVRTTSTTAWHALMLLMSCALPCEVSVPSLRRMIEGCIIDDGGMPGIPPRPPIMVLKDSRFGSLQRARKP